jgi:hypothetical protein
MIAQGGAPRIGLPERQELVEQLAQVDRCGACQLIETPPGVVALIPISGGAWAGRVSEVFELNPLAFSAFRVFDRVELGAVSGRVSFGDIELGRRLIRVWSMALL